MTTLSTPVQNRFAYGSASVNGSTPRIEHQITYFRPNRSPTGPPMMVPGGHRAEEDEQVELRALHADAELVDQVEGVVARRARQVDVLREDQHDQHAERERAPGRATASDAPAPAAARAAAAARAVPRGTSRPTRQSTTIATSAAHREPGHAALAARQHDERGQQRPDRRAGVAADLEQRLREAVPSARRHPRDARATRGGTPPSRARPARPTTSRP